MSVTALSRAKSAQHFTALTLPRNVAYCQEANDMVENNSQCLNPLSRSRVEDGLYHVRDPIGPRQSQKWLHGLNHPFRLARRHEVVSKSIDNTVCIFSH